MPKINFSKRTLTCKLVYYGPGLSGKTSNLEHVYQQVPEDRRGELTSISTHGDRTIFYDFLPIDMGTIAGLTTRLQLFTVPGQTYYAATRRLVLVGVDGIVFVADSQPERLNENIEAYNEMVEVLREQKKDLALLPHVIQWNKRDLPGAMPVADLERALNRHGVPTFETVASKGERVLVTLRTLARLVLSDANSEYGAPIPMPERPTPMVERPTPMVERPGPRPKVPAAPVPRPVSLDSMAESREDTRPFGVSRRPLESSDMLATSHPSIPLDSVAEEKHEVVEEERTIGQIVGGCVILAKLGEGGMGSVYLARHKALGKDFVIKTLRPDRKKNRTSVQRFFAEARATARLEHENVVRVQDVGTTAQGMHYMIMQYVDGVNLEDKVREEGHLGHLEATRIVLEVARALIAIHTEGVIHRDIKPQNIIVTSAGGVKLIDFGLARDVADKVRLTRQGGLVGTPAYMAPEMITGKSEVDGRVDLFALGLTFYYLLTGETPFMGTDIHELFLGKARLEPPEIFVPDLPGGYRVVLERMLAEDRDARYANASALALDLEVLAKGGDLDTGERRSFWLWSESQPPKRPKSKRNKPLVNIHGETTPDLVSPPPPPPPPPPRARAKRPKRAAGNPLVREIQLAKQNSANHLENCILLSSTDQSPFGHLHRAWDTKSSRLVAVRLIEGFRRLDPNTDAALGEVTRMRHAHIPNLHRYGVTDEGELYMISQLVRGRTLSSYRFKPKAVVFAIRDVARALQAAHDQSLIHGNLQPSSVLIDESGKGFLLDLGLAGAFDRQGATAAGKVLQRVSSRYQAPECLNRPGDALSDIYALGASFYFGLTRQPPGTGTVVPPRRLRGGIPRTIQEICLRCLEQAPKDRYPSAKHLVGALNEFLKAGPRKSR